ncbi:MAG: hypothetical protein KGH88_00240 [Thaumarchaeota archaeon]|nr:hypothetical protein [Nitrososphaerota archaeon]
MAKIMRTPEMAAERHLAHTLRAYLEGKITEAMFEGQVKKGHSPEALKSIIENSRYSYLHEINPERLEQIKTEFLSE